MSHNLPARPLSIVEWWIAFVLPMGVPVVGMAMIRVASGFGFIAPGEPAVAPHP